MDKGQQVVRKEPLHRKQPSDVIRVLLIEDNPGYSEVIRLMLEKDNGTRFDCVGVKKLGDGLNHLRRKEVDVILLDLKLPDSQGIETFDRLFAYVQGIPIIVLTVTDNDELAIEAVQKGAQDYLVKEQVDAKSLVHAIRYAIERNRVEDTLRETTLFLQNILESSYAISILYTDCDGNILYWNKGAENIFGYKADEIVGYHKADILYPQDEIETKNKIAEIKAFIITNKRGASSEVREITRDGRKLWINLHLTPRFDQDGQLLGILGIGLDITERKRMGEMLLNAAQEWRTTFDAISDIVCLIDSEKKIIRCNRAMTNLVGKPFIEIIGHSCCERIHGTKESFEGCPFERMMKTHHTETVVLQRGDQWFNVSVDPLSDEKGNLIGGVHIMTDITKEKEIDKMKTELISNVSHELRTPLTTIKEGISLVYDGTLGPLDAAQKDIMGRVKNNIDRLARLINDLLDISRIDAGRMELRKTSVNIVVLVEEVISLFQNQAKNKKIELTTSVEEDLHSIYIDRDRISQVLTNLISNSVKFTQSHGRIVVDIKDYGTEIEISVTDTGIGISSQNVAGLFDRFSQFNRVYGPGERGTGLGLAISKEIVEMHGGRIWVESQVGRGSTFYFSLPLLSQEEIFREYLIEGLREASSKGCPLSLVVIHVKHVKKIMRACTDAQAFSILSEIEGLIAKTLRRKSDIVSRYKYDEIIIAILMDTAKKDALSVKERIRQEIEIEIKEKGWPKDIGLFLDVVTFPDDAMDEMELINKLSQGLWTEERGKGGKDGEKENLDYR
jgi:PAS domain S-box-containing protein/diguanylate cyclase (GGDEF)-like protein